MAIVSEDYNPDDLLMAVNRKLYDKCFDNKPKPKLIIVNQVFMDVFATSKPLDFKYNLETATIYDIPVLVIDFLYGAKPFFAFPVS